MAACEFDTGALPLQSFSSHPTQLEFKAARPDSSIYFSTQSTLSILSLPDTHSYLTRIGLPVSTATEPPSLDLLAKLLLAQQTTTPYDTSALHVSKEDWNGPNRPIVLGGGKEMMELGKGNFNRIVGRQQGGFCYALNGAFSSFLRGFGFSVSEVGARVYLHRGKDPKEEGWLWSPITHETLLVRWIGSDGRYFIDAGFGGGGCPYPILLKDGQTSPSLSRTESFLLIEETMPDNSTTILEDLPLGFTLYRRVLPPGLTISSPLTASTGPGHWSPCIHFSLTTLSPSDITMANYYNEHHPNAPFVNFFVVSILLKNGKRRTISYGAAPVDMNVGGAQGTGRKAKLYTKEGVRGVEEDVSWVEFETGALREVLEREFGFRF
ncbi:hypothetical protein P7C70_g185, partial [Phenoliferia sp. Uapishka_3]